MKTMTCYDCDHEMSAPSREEMLNEMYAHYMSTHKEIITGANESEKQAWMKQFDVDFEAA